MNPDKTRNTTILEIVLLGWTIKVMIISKDNHTFGRSDWGCWHEVEEIFWATSNISYWKGV